MSSLLLDQTKLTLVMYVNNLADSTEFFEIIGMRTISESRYHVMFNLNAITLVLYETDEEIPQQESWSATPYLNLRDRHKSKSIDYSYFHMIGVRNLDDIAKKLNNAGYEMLQKKPIKYNRHVRAIYVKDLHGRPFLLVE